MVDMLYWATNKSDNWSINGIVAVAVLYNIGEFYFNNKYVVYHNQ